MRLLAIVLAMLTDCIDGYLARRSRSTSRFGAVLDPAMDKFFVYFALTIFFLEKRILLLGLLAMLSRDFFVLLYALLMTALGRRRHITLRAIRWGKVTTALQFLVLIALTLTYPIPWVVHPSFVIMGLLAFAELLQLHNPFLARIN